MSRSSRRRSQLARRLFETLEARLAMAAIQDWFERGAGGGGALFSPSINPVNTNEMYIASDMGQVFHTTNEGASWQTVDFHELQGSNNAKVQFTSNSHIMYALDYTSGGDFVRPTKSTDGGATWTPLAADPTDGEAITLIADYNNPQRIVVSDYSRVFISSDGGATFQQRFTTSDANGVHLGGAFFDGNNIYLGTNQGVLVSTNGGTSFSTAPWSGIPSTQRIVSLAGAKENGTTRLWAVTMGSGDVYGGVQGWDYYGYQGIYKIDVGQASWTSITSGITAGAMPFYVSAALNDIDIVYVSGGSDSSRPTVFKSTTGGGAWQSVLNTINNANVQTGWSGDGGNRGWSYGEVALDFEVSPLDSTRVVITDYGFAHMSEDGGASWRALYVAPGDLNAANASIPPSKTYHSSGLDNTTVWGVTWTSPTHLIASNSDIRGVQSSDGGQTWGFNYTGHTANSMYRSIVQPTTGVVYAAAASVHDMYQSTHLADSTINSGTGSVLFSTNGGTTWQTMHNFGRVVMWVEADPTNPNRLYAATASSVDGGIWVTNNANLGAASTWTKLAAPPRTEGHAFNIRALNDGTLVVTYSGRRTSAGFTASSGVFVSTDGGQTWQDRSDPGMRYWTKDVVIDPHDASQNTWYTSVFSGWGGAPNGLGGLYKTTDRGLHWTRINALDRVNSITISPTNPDEAYLTTEVDGLWYTENLRSATPTFTQVQGYHFLEPMRVEYNPYNTNEVWVTSFGGGMRVGYATPPAASPGSVALGQTSYTISEDGGSLLVSVSRTGGSSGAVSVSYATANGTAIAGQDFSSVSGSLSWADGETGAKTFSVPLINDNLVESNENFTIALSNPTNGLTLGTPNNATVTLTSEDVAAQPGVVRFAQSAYTANETGGSVTISVVRADGSSGPISVGYATASGTAIAGQDFVGTSGTLSWAAGETGAKTFVVSIINDVFFENNESFGIALSNPTGGAALGSPNSTTVSIASEDLQPILAFSTSSYQVGEGTPTATITVVRSGNVQGSLSVNYSATAGTATANQDFTPASGTLNFADGETEKTFNVSILEDSLSELAESINLTLSSPTGGAALGQNDHALLEILDNDPAAPPASVYQFEKDLYETREDYGYRAIYVTRSGDISQPGSVRYATHDGTALVGSDYVGASGIINFAAGQKTAAFQLKLVNNSVFEPTETMTITLFDPAGGTLGDRDETTVRIADDEVNAAGAIQFDRADYSTKENYGYVVIYLTRSGGTTGAVSVQLSVTPGSAQPGGDYVIPPATVNFAAGAKQASVKIYLVNDEKLEVTETAQLTISNPTGGATLGTQATATLTIADDEINSPGALAFIYSTWNVQENWGYARIYVERTDGLIGEVKVDYSVGGGTAVAGTHYTPVSGTLTFADGERTAYFDIPIINNKTYGGSHTLQLFLTNPQGGARLGAIASAWLTIKDDEKA